MARKTNKKSKGPFVFEVTGRKPAAAVLLAVLVAMLLLVTQMLIQLGFVIELFGAACLIAWLAKEAIRLYTLKMQIELGEDTLVIRRGETVVYDGPVYAVKPTTVPLWGVAFAVVPKSIGDVLSMNFAQVFVMNVRRHRLALPGVFLVGLQPILEHIRD